MKGIILAGGSGSRLAPLTKVTNKHLLPVGLEPMIYHPVKQMVQAGIREILVVTGGEHLGAVAGLLGGGEAFGCAFTYRVQEGPKGIAHALALGEAFAGGAKVLVLLGDNIFARSLRPFADRFRAQASGARVLLKAVEDPRRYGVATLRGDRVLEIEEKPSEPKSNLAVVGAYGFDAALWDIIRGIGPSARGEYEITAVNNAYIQRGALAYDRLEGAWSDAGTFESLAEANAMMLAAGNTLSDAEAPS